LRCTIPPVILKRSYSGGRAGITAGCKSSVVTPILPSFPLPLAPTILFWQAHICCSSSPPSSSAVLSLGCKAMVRSYCSSSRVESGSALWGPGLPIRNTRYAYNSRSHDQCVVNPHIRVDNRITSSFEISNNILTIGHMTKHDIATQGKSTTKQRIPSSVDDPSHAYYPTGN
jgi:hypothetical protein